MKKTIITLLFLAAAVSRPGQAEANDIPNALLGTWNVSQSGTDLQQIYEKAAGQSTIWILKPDSNNVLTVEAYGVSSTGIVFPKPFPVVNIGYEDGKMVIVTRDNNVMTTTTSFSIAWSFGAPNPTGSGRYRIITSMAAGDMLLCAIGACGMSSESETGSGAIMLSKKSSALVPPPSKRQPSPSPAPSYGSPAFPNNVPLLPNSGAGFPMYPTAPFMMPPPSYPSPSRSNDFAPTRNTNGCMINKQMCSNGCDPPSYGHDKDFGRINSCRNDCEQIYSRCMGQ